MKNIVVAVDFSEATGPAIAAASSLARCCGGRLWLLHVAAPEPDFIGLDLGPQHERDQLAQQFHSEHRQLQAWEAQLQSQGISASALLIRGPTIDKITAEARRLQADVIALGSHGHGALRSALLGSVTMGVIRHSHCPVLIVPSPQTTAR